MYAEVSLKYVIQENFLLVLMQPYHVSLNFGLNSRQQQEKSEIPRTSGAKCH